MKHWLKQHVIFALTVLLPTVAAILYFGLIASDVYISEARFVVRSPQRQVQTGLVGALLQGTGFARSQDDTYSVHDFITSRDALAELEKKLSVRKLYTSPKVDFINRFPGLDWDDSFEAFYLYYQKKVTIDFDTASSITALRVRAFVPADSQRINDLLLQMGERLVNELNERSRQDLIRFAEREVGLAEEKVKEAAFALSAFRSKQAVFEPDRQASIQLQGVAKIQEELLATEGQLAQLRKLSPNNPQVPALENKAATLRRAMAAESAKVTGDSGSYSARAPAFERLTLEKGFADRQLGVALTALETARSEAQRKQLYLERIVQPSLPDESVEPRRIRSVFTVFVLGLVAWGVASLLVASVREHVD
jgi:capsular polysaccharide transport system permease protein